MNAQRIEARADKIAESVWFRLLARGSMIALGPALSLIIWLGLQWLDYRMNQQVVSVVNATRKEIQTQIDDVTDENRRISDRVLTLETNTARGRADREKFQDDAMAILQEQSKLLSTIASRLAAVEALQAAQQRQIERSGN